MPNVENLIPVSSESEAREKGQKGGFASATARRKKKAMREMAELVLAAPMPASKAKLNELVRLGFTADDANVQLLALLAVAKQATKGDLPALQFLRDTAGEKPSDKLDMTQRLTGDFVLEIGMEPEMGDEDAAEDPP